jgi:hypothetical protein
MELKYVSQHATIQYIQRHKHSLIKKMKDEIKKKLKGSHEVYPINGAIKLMNNGYKNQKYFRKDDIVFVISEDQCIVTILNWNYKSFKY